MGIATLAAGGLLLLPGLVHAQTTAEWLPLGATLGSGALLGIGRQGIDVLLFRCLSVTVGLIVVVIVNGIVVHGVDCTSTGCWPVMVFGIVTVSLLMLVATVPLALVALAASRLWNKSFAPLQPEIRWSTVLRRFWWVAALFAAGVPAVAGAFVASLLALGIGAPP